MIRSALAIGTAARPEAAARVARPIEVIFQSGWGKLHDLEKVTSFFTELGLPAAAFQARLASTTELVCGGLLLVGLATRFAAVPLVVTMAVAIRTALWDQVEVDGIPSLVGLQEFAYVAPLLWLATDGAGPLSLDRLLARTASHGAPEAMPAGQRRAPRSDGAAAAVRRYGAWCAVSWITGGKVNSSSGGRTRTVPVTWIASPVVSVGPCPTTVIGRPASRIS